jgi:putative peptidoglycan lipid II flippase
MFAKSFLTVSGFTLLSRISGFIRDVLIARYMGAGVLADVFFVALRLPNFFRTIFAEGAFNASFVPMFSGKLQGENRQEAILFAERILSVLIIGLLIITSVFMVFMPLVMHVFAGGFAVDESKFDLAVFLTRVTFPYLFFISITFFFAAILNSLNKFSAYAFTPVLFNICLVFFLVVITKFTATPAHALAFGVIAAGIVQLIWILYQCKKAGIKIRLVKPKLSTDVKQFFRKFFPGVIGSSVNQINMVVNTFIASSFGGAISYLYYAERLVQLPLSLIGTAMGTVLLPTLSKHFSANEFEKGLEVKNKALTFVLFITLPAAFALFTIALPIVGVLFERGEFSATDSTFTAYAIMIFALALPAFVMIKIFSNTFFALKDTKTPVKIDAYCIILGIILNITFVNTLPEYGVMPHLCIAMGTLISSWINVITQSIVLYKRGRFLINSEFKTKVIKIFISAIIMASALYFVEGRIEHRLLNLIATISIGGGVYVALVAALKIYTIAEVKAVLKKNRN